MAKKSTAQEAISPTQDDFKKDFQSYFDDQGYLPQTTEAYTALAVVQTSDNLYVVRQTDIIKSQVVAEYDSPEMFYAEAVERFKVAVSEFIR